MSFSKMIRNRILASKNVLLGVGMTTPFGALNPDSEVLAKLNELPIPYAELLVPLSAYPEQNADLLGEYGATAIAHTELVSELNAHPAFDSETLAELNDPQMPDAVSEILYREQLMLFLRRVEKPLPVQGEPQRNIIVATRLRRQFFGEQLELVERRDQFYISATEQFLLQVLLPTFAQQIANPSSVIELEISSQTMFLLLKLIRRENLHLYDYTRAALEKIRLEAEALKCTVLIKQIEKFENRFK